MFGLRQIPMLQARVFVIEDGKILTFLRGRRDKRTGEMFQYYSFPGGEVNKGETVEQAAVRETKEEMGVDIALGPKVAVQNLDGFVNHAFSATIVSGVPQLMPDSEEVFFSSKHNTYEVKWVQVSELTPENLIYYAKFLPIIQDLSVGETPSQPVHLTND